MAIVYVLSNQRKPLMPTTSAIARHLLKNGKAKVIRKPFTIKLQYESSTYTQAANPWCGYRGAKL